jgi:hypothetical protein
VLDCLQIVAAIGRAGEGFFNGLLDQATMMIIGRFIDKAGCAKRRSAIKWL